jgi:hypothetical protein
MNLRRFILALICFFALTPTFASVPYTLEGCVTVDNHEAYLHTGDGRVFRLDMDLAKAKSFHDLYVIVEGIAKEADDLAVLKVKKITRHDPAIPVPPPAPYKDYQRPARKIAESAGAITMDNVRWGFDPKAADGVRFFWEKAVIRPELVENVYFVKKPFPPEWLAAHSLLAYTFKPGGMVNSKGQSARGLVLTIEAYQRKDQKYDLKAGLKKTFGAVWILTTWEDYSSYACDLENKRMIAYPVRFTHEQKVNLVKETLAQSSVNRQGEFYHTITNNCTNNLIVLFNRVMAKKIKMWWLPSMVYNIRATMPTMVPAYLIKKGIIGKALPEINKSNYFGDLLK